MQAQLLKQPNAPTNNVYSLVPKQKKSVQIARPIQAQSHYLESTAGLLFVILAHASVIYWLLQQSTTPVIQANQAKPMMVSLIALPAPTPESAPIIEPPKPIAEPKPKKMVEKIKPIETPTERLVEVSMESNKEQEITALQALPVLESKQAPAPQMAEPIIEDVIEPPRFGVSYLNNPAPDYPAMSRRAGEEGRVVMKVLVSTEGLADEVQIEKSSGSERLDDAAMNAVKKWRFIPAKKNNQPLSAYVLVPMKFSLDS
ncbi:MAG: energy transducer TonB [Methylotenera sp.]